MKARTKQENSMVEGVIWKQMLSFFLPILLGSFFQQLYNTADALIVGRTLGDHALAAVGGSTAMITSTVVSFFLGLTSGAAIIAAQKLGARDRNSINESIHTIYAFSIIAGILLSLAGVFLSKAMLLWMNTPLTLMADSQAYLQIYFAGLVFVLIYNTGASILRALGDAKRPFWYLVVCCIVNVVLDYVLIVYGHMGVAGAALATVLAQGISAVLVTVRLMHFRDVCDFSLRRLRINRKMLKNELYLGLPGGIQAAMYSISNIIATVAINGFGEQTVAAWTAYCKFDGLFAMIGSAIGVTITTFVGQNFGARQMDRIQKGVRMTKWAYAATAVLVSTAMIIFREPMLHIFVKSRETMEIGCRMLLIISPFYIVNTHTENYAGALRGIGDTMIPMLISVCGICVFRVLYLGIFFSLYPTLEVLFAMYPISWILTDVLYLIYYPISVKRLMR